jgi:hypothetical protein
MTGLCTCRACFAARAAARAAGLAEAQCRTFFLPGSKSFSLAALPPYLELVRRGRGWIVRKYRAPQRSGRPA